MKKTQGEMKPQKLEELIEEYKKRFTSDSEKNVTEDGTPFTLYWETKEIIAFIKKVYEAGGEAERENIKQITKNHLWKEAGTYDFDGIAEDIINYLVEKNENK